MLKRFEWFADNFNIFLLEAWMSGQSCQRYKGEKLSQWLENWEGVFGFGVENIMKEFIDLVKRITVGWEDDSEVIFFFSHVPKIL